MKLFLYPYDTLFYCVLGSNPSAVRDSQHLVDGEPYSSAGEGELTSNPNRIKANPCQILVEPACSLSVIFIVLLDPFAKAPGKEVAHRGRISQINGKQTKDVLSIYSA